MDAEGQRRLRGSLSHVLLAGNIAQAVQQGVAGGDRLAASAFCSATAGVAAALNLTGSERMQLELYHAEPANAAVAPDITLLARPFHLLR